MKKQHFGQILTIVLLASLCLGSCKCKKKKHSAPAPAPAVHVPVPAPVFVPPPVVVQPTPPVFSEGRQWVNHIVSVYPEITWLANAAVRKTEEGQAAVDKPYSEQMFGQKFIEFDRSLMSLYCMKLILDGSDKSYQEFTAAQPENVKLSRESFRTLHEQGIRLVNSNYQNITPFEMLQAMETALVLGDLGKSEVAREIFKVYGAYAPDHDDFHGQAMAILRNNPLLSHSFSRLSYPAQQLLLKVANLAHYGHVTHLEGGPSMFSKLKQSNVPTTDASALSFDLFVHTCDVAGALGHVNNTSSIVYTEQTHRAMQAMAQACHVLTDPAKTEADAYDAYISVRASWIGLNPSDRDDRVLTRIAAMLRLFTPEEGTALKNAISQLSSEDRQRIVSQLDVRLGEEVGRTPTYMPAVLVNLYNNKDLGATPSERLSQAVIRGLPFLAKVLQHHHEKLAQNQASLDIPLNFNKVAGVAKSKPDLLLKNEFQIESDGNVIIQ
jgi:hypothetical protein